MPLIQFPKAVLNTNSIDGYYAPGANNIHAIINGLSVPTHITATASLQDRAIEALALITKATETDLNAIDYLREHFPTLNVSDEGNVTANITSLLNS